jgi:hypothetical protein
MQIRHHDSSLVSGGALSGSAFGLALWSTLVAPAIIH